MKSRFQGKNNHHQRKLKQFKDSVLNQIINLPSKLSCDSPTYKVIPYDFAVKYLSEEIGTIKLQTTDCRNWQLLYKWCRTDRATYAYISSGWKHFAEDNRLKEGDIGLFQLVNKHSFSFTKLQNNSLPPEKETAATGNPFFEVNNIPLKFANEYFSPEMQSADLQVGNKKWNVILKQYEDSQVVGGTFRGESGLKDGDKCLFEMVNTEQCVFKMIPKKFVEDYGKVLSNSVNLKLSDGREWKMEGGVRILE
ncbi:B3 domain-containing protein [Cucumis melo var. makuwa]|uniref:B3 domain-containing protein n=1 Tax=Cucumis melo var. makuwa TaxID=1194695 RepID=A0A5D3CN99_CUCMM|nr:B3 domain-containing protein [Cucumis melo var. makuwa]